MISSLVTRCDGEDVADYTPRPDLVPTDLEAVCVEINQANSQSFIISGIYRPPCSTNEVFKKSKN